MTQWCGLETPVNGRLSNKGYDKKSLKAINNRLRVVVLARPTLKRATFLFSWHRADYNNRFRGRQSETLLFLSPRTRNSVYFGILAALCSIKRFILTELESPAPSWRHRASGTLRFIFFRPFIDIYRMTQWCGQETPINGRLSNKELDKKSLKAINNRSRVVVLDRPTLKRAHLITFLAPG